MGKNSNSSEIVEYLRENIGKWVGIGVVGSEEPASGHLKEVNDEFILVIPNAENQKIIYPIKWIGYVWFK